MISHGKESSTTSFVADGHVTPPHLLSTRHANGGPQRPVHMLLLRRLARPLAWHPYPCLARNGHRLRG
eukprot:173055-Prorocentrum_lima.AAC.1